MPGEQGIINYEPIPTEWVDYIGELPKKKWNFIPKNCDTFKMLTLEKDAIICVSGENKQAALLMTQIKNRMEGSV